VPQDSERRISKRLVQEIWNQSFKIFVSGMKEEENAEENCSIQAQSNRLCRVAGRSNL
jgi:hypothetical protein